MKPRKILLIEDEFTDAELMRIYLRNVIGDFEVDLHHEATFFGGLSALEEKDFDLILMDLGLPDIDWKEGMETMNRHHKSIPLIVVTGYEDEQRRIDAMRLGAQEYLIKDHFDSYILQRAIESTINRFELLCQLQDVFEMADMYYWIYDALEHEVKLQLQFNGSPHGMKGLHLSLEEFLQPLPNDIRIAIKELLQKVTDTNLEHSMEYEIPDNHPRHGKWLLKLRPKEASKKIIALSIRR